MRCLRGNQKYFAPSAVAPVQKINMSIVCQFLLTVKGRNGVAITVIGQEMFGETA